MTTNEQIHAAMLARLTRQIIAPNPQVLVDYWCRDCRNGYGDYFRAPHNPDMHAKGSPCPNGHVFNTYQAWTE